MCPAAPSVPGAAAVALRVAAVLAALLALCTPARAASVVTDWVEVATRAADEVTPEPTAGARFFAVLFTATYDAWAAYDARAVGVATGDVLRGTGGPPTVLNKREAVSHAAYRALLALAPSHRRYLDAFMAEQGYDPESTSAPAMLGRRAAAAVLALRADDGANQAGGYHDASHYAWADGADPGRWQPVPFDGLPQEPMTPHWLGVAPFGLRRADQFRPPPPPTPGTPAFDRQVEEALALSAGLTDEHKATAEYWAPFGSHPASHLVRLTEWVSLRDDLGLDADVRLFFVAATAVFDAGVATWDAKYHYDYVRPVTAVRRLGERPVRVWASPAYAAGTSHLPNRGERLTWGAAHGTAEVPARLWEPYLPTPPFPEYVSGHSAFTAAWARALELATGSDRFGYHAEWPYLFVEGRQLEQPVALAYPTFTSAAEASGQSRLYGGIHWAVGNEQGLRLGRAVAGESWATAQMYVTGGARPAAAAVEFLTEGPWQAEGDAQADGGLALTVAAGAWGRWQTAALDPLPALPYELVATVESPAGGAPPLRLAVVAASDGRPLGEARVESGPLGQAVLAFESDGETPFRLVFEAGTPGGAAGTVRLVGLHLRARRWPGEPPPAQRSRLFGPSRRSAR